MAEIAYSKSAIKALRRTPVNRAARIRAKIEQLAEDPAALAANVKRLEGRDGYRLRVGDWRVIFERQGDDLIVLNIGPRGGIYE